MKTEKEIKEELSFWLKAKQEIINETEGLKRIDIRSSGNTLKYMEGKISILEWVLNL